MGVHQPGGPARPRYQHTRWNFVVIVIESSFFIAGLAFIDPVAVLPVLVNALTGSEVLVGLMAAIQRTGWIVPQLLAASFVLHRTRKKPFVIWPCIIARVPFVGLAAAFTLVEPGSHTQALLGLLIGVYTVFFFTDGLVGVPWQDIIARTIPPWLRGRFFGSMQFIGGLLTIGAAWMVRRVLADPSLPFPQNYGRLFILLCACMALSTVALVLLREPAGSQAPERQSLLSILRAVPGTLRRYPILRRVVILHNLCGLGGLALPFYAIYGQQRLHLPDYVAGTFIGAATIGAVGASLLWAYINDRHGSAWLVRSVALVALGPPIGALCMLPITGAVGSGPEIGYIYAGVFLLNGATGGGLWMAFTNYVMEIAPEDTRPLFLGLAATLTAPTVLLPVLGGWMLGAISYETLFAIVVAGSVVAFGYSLRLPPAEQLPMTTANSDFDMTGGSAV